MFERIEDEKLSAAKVTFGAEPKDCEVYEFILKHYENLRFIPSVTADVKGNGISPRRMQRDIIANQEIAANEERGLSGGGGAVEALQSPPTRPSDGRTKPLLLPTHIAVNFETFYNFLDCYKKQLQSMGVGTKSQQALKL